MYAGPTCLWLGFDRAIYGLSQPRVPTYTRVALLALAFDLIKVYLGIIQTTPYMRTLFNVDYITLAITT